MATKLCYGCEQIEGLRELYFGEYFNSILCAGVLPPGLTVLHFDQQINCGSLPEGLTEL